MELTEHDYFIAALSQAYYSGMDLSDVLRAATESSNAEDLDRRIGVMSAYWLEVGHYENF